MPSPIQGITFDAAGTLFHIAEPVGETYARFGAEFGFDLSSTALNQAFRQAWKAMPDLHDRQFSQDSPSPDAAERAWWRFLVNESFRLAAADSNSEGAPVTDALFEALFDHFASPEAWQLYPETISVLQQLADRFPLAVISNFDRRFHSIADGLDIPGYFRAIILSGEVGSAKPSTEIYQAAHVALNLPPGSLLHTGDDPEADWEGARKAGFQVFELTRPDNTLRALLDMD